MRSFIRGLRGKFSRALSSARDYGVSELIRKSKLGKLELTLYNVITSLNRDALLQILYFNLAGGHNKALVMLIYLLLLL